LRKQAANEARLQGLRRGRPVTPSSVLAGSGTLAKFRIVLSLARQSDSIFPSGIRWPSTFDPD